MDRDGSNPHQVYSPGWDPTWSPDGQKILFATTIDTRNQLFTVDLDGTDLRQMADIDNLRGEQRLVT